MANIVSETVGIPCLKAGEDVKPAIPILWLLAPLAFGLLALVLGQDASWDLRNYHYYNPHAFLNGRLDYDIAPAQVATWYNPLLHIPFYLAVEAWPPRVVAFALGAIQGLNVPLLALVAQRLVDPAHRAAFPWLVPVLAVLGVLGAGNLSETGTTFGDNVLSLPILAALLLTVARHDDLLRPGRAALATASGMGLLCGLAAGLKQPFAIYGIGLGAAFLFLPVSFSRRIVLGAAFSAGAIGGTALTGGFWLYEMWERYGNPLFPYFNHVFQSPWASAADYRDARFLPDGWFEWCCLPLAVLRDPFQAGEVAFRDPRIPLLFVLLVVLGVQAVITRRAVTPPVERTTASARRFLLLAGLVAYVAWLKIFAIWRYLMVIELLAPLAAWLILVRLVPDPRRALPLGGLMAVAVLALLRPGDWERVDFGDDYLGVPPLPVAEPERALVLTAGHDPLSYLIPSFPASVRFVRISSYFTGPSDAPNDTDRRIRALIEAQEGPMYFIFRGYEREVAMPALAFHGLQVDEARCQSFVPHVESNKDEPLWFCPVVRAEKS